MSIIELNQEQLVARGILAELTKENFCPEDILDEMLINIDLGIDSLQFIRLILELEAKVEKQIFNVENIARIKTVADLYQVLEEVKD